MTSQEVELMGNKAISIARGYDWEKLSSKYVKMYNGITDHN